MRQLERVARRATKRPPDPATLDAVTASLEPTDVLLPDAAS